MPRRQVGWYYGVRSTSPLFQVCVGIAKHTHVTLGAVCPLLPPALFFLYRLTIITEYNSTSFHHPRPEQARRPMTLCHFIFTTALATMHNTL